jgi:hypothetical protein
MMDVPKRAVLLLAILSLCMGVVTYAGDSTSKPAVVAATDTAALAAHIGDFVTVEGTISKASWSTTGKVMIVDFQGADRKKGLLCSAFDRNKENLDDANGGDAAAKWTGAKVRITGKLEPYDGKIEDWKDRPQIIIQNPEQVVIVKPAGK